MVFKGERAVFFGRETYVSIVVLAVALLVVAALLASPARAQTVSGDRNQTNICNNIVEIIINDVQNPGVDVTISGDVSSAQVANIAQALNISPRIVQQCIQQNAGRDIIVVNDSNDRSNNDRSNNDRSNEADGSDPGDLESGASTLEDCISVEAADRAVSGDTSSSVSASTEECTIVDTAPNKPLANTGGLPITMIYYSFVGGVILVLASLLTGFVVCRARQL